MQPSGVRARVAIVTGALLVVSLQAASAWATTTPHGNRNGASGAPSSVTTPSVRIGGGWTRFTFEGPGSVTRPFTFTHRTPVVLSVTDAFCVGDRLAILDNGHVVGVTSAPAVGPTCHPPFQAKAAQPAFYQGLYSAGMVLLPKGAHKITIRAIRSPFGAGGAFLRVDACTRFLTRPGKLKGTAGDDTLCGSPGNDTIIGGPGNDRIVGGGGNDTLQGSSGNDAIAGGPGSDLIAGQRGNDRLFGNAGTDLITGGPNHDGISGGLSADALYAGGGPTNVVVGEAGGDSLFGGPGNDLLSGNSGSDLLQGAAGTDLCIGGPGADAAVGCESLEGIP
jgi:hypothetical protein